MKSDSLPPHFPHHRFTGNILELTWNQGSVTLGIPLMLRLGSEAIRFRKWAVRQGGAQARAERGGGFVAVDFRRPAFHYRGKMPHEPGNDMTMLEDVQVEGWELLWPGQTDGPLRIDASTVWTCRPGAPRPTGAGYLEPRLWVLRRPGTSAGLMISCAGPGHHAGVELSIRDGRLSLTYLEVDLTPAAESLPDLYLVPGITTLAAAEAEQERIVGKEGFVRLSDRGRLWWRRPTLYVPNSVLRATPRQRGADLARRLEQTLQALARRAPIQAESPHRGAILALDSAWADTEGDWNPSCPLFDDFDAWKAFHAELREAGHAVVLTLSPFTISPGSQLAQESPWCLLRNASGFPLSDAEGNYFLDYTLVNTRDLMADTVEFLLGPGEEELGADGICLAPTEMSPNRDVAWSDPTWSNGEMLWTRVMTMLAERARQVAPAALVEVEAAVAFAKRTADRIGPLGLLGRRTTPAHPRELHSYGQAIPHTEGVRFARTADDWAQAARGQGYYGVIYQAGGES